MASTFGGINTALSSLYAQRRGLDVAGQNIANANTEGYTRQRVVMQSQTGTLNPAVYAKGDGLGSGVSVTTVQRMRDEYLEARGRTEHANKAYLTGQAATYNAIENVFAEPSDTALQARLHDMWDAWNDVANNPQIPATRSKLIESSVTVASTLNDAHASLASQFTQQRTQLDAYVDEVNQLATSVAKLNRTIVQAKAGDTPVNELEDQRASQVMRLAVLTGAASASQSNGAVNVYVGNSPLVSEFATREVRAGGAARMQDLAADPLALRWADTGTVAQAGGTVGSMVDAMTSVLPSISEAIDAVALKLADTVNTAHRTGHSADGSTNLDFFSGTTAADLRVAVTDPAKVAVSSVAGALNNTVADTLADVGTSTTGPDQSYQVLIGQLGVAAQAAGRRNDIQSTVTDQVDAARAAESGVNLDEEMTNLLTYQRGYEAASRVLTTIDSMLDQLINRTGLVGR